MKRCPNCDQIFGDENDYCLDDGTPLRADTAWQGFVPSQSSGEMPTQYIRQPTPAAASSKWLYLIIGILSATVIGGGLFFILQKQGDEAADAKTGTRANIHSEDTAANNVTPKRADAGAAENRATTPIIPVSTPPPRPRVSTRRVRFARGAIAASVSGSLPAGDVRNYILACRAGQQLTATLSASRECLQFQNGSTVFQSFTRKGDNTVTIINRCESVANYTLEITVI